MNLTDLITPAMIDAAREADACEHALAWLEEVPRTLGELIERHPHLALWGHGHGVIVLTPEQADACAKADPDTALIYVTALLSPERLDLCAQVWPDLAILYAARLLSPERLDLCAQVWPDLALEFASRLLTPERQAWCKRAIA